MFRADGILTGSVHHLQADLNEKEKEAAQAGDTKPAEEGKEAEEGSVGERVSTPATVVTCQAKLESAT